MQLHLNQTKYTVDPIRVDLTRNYFSEAFNAYKNCCKDFRVETQLSPNDWRKLYLIFCFDLSAQNEDIKKNSCDVTINIEKSGADNLTAFAVVFEDTYREISIINGVMSRIN